MKTMQWKFAVVAMAVSSLSACGWEHLNKVESNTGISGVAATGAPISGGTVDLRCVGDYSTSTTTGSDGKWSATVPSDALPCNVKVSGGTPAGTFYSVAQKPSGTATTTTANITPLTDLVTAAVVNSAPGRQALEVWFENDSAALRQQVAAGMASGVEQLRAALEAAGYELPSDSFDPFTAAIVPGGAEDLYDLILEAYKQALADAGSSYEDARGDYATDGGLPEAGTGPGPVTPTNTALSSSETGVRFVTTGTVRGTTETNNLRYWTGPGSVTVGSNAGILNEVTVTGPEDFSYFNLRDVPDAVGTYDCGYGVSSNQANVEIGFAAGHGYNTAGTRGASGTFTQGFRCSLTITKVGTRNGSNYTGTYEGSVDAQLYKSGQTINTQNSISVKGHFRIGTPATVDPVTPSTSTSLFGKSMTSLYVGNYTLKCAPSVGQTVETFAFSIAANGGSTFNGAALVDATHPGIITSSGSPESDMTLKIAATTGDKNYVVLGFKKNGTFQPNSVNFKSGSTTRTLMCYFTTGNVAPAAASGAVADLKNVVIDQARSGTLDCRNATQGTDVKTPTSYSINSDGSAQIAGLSFAAKDLTEIKDAILFADAAANASTKTASISYAVIDSSYQVIRTLAVGLGSDLKTTGILYSSGSVSDPANSHICVPQ